jgi:hypothetical protein
MSKFDCDYEAETRAAMEMAAKATSEVERCEWLLLAMAWQALARCHDFQQSTPAPNKPASDDD